MITVKLLNILADHSPLKQREFSIDHAPGLRVRDIVAYAGLEDRLVQMIIVNGRIGRPDTPLADGDQVMLSPFIAGG